jgi:hypothetical protein
MPAGLPGSTAAENAANPSVGRFVIFDPLSGPKGSPLDRGGSSYSSTGALQTGIGYSALPVIAIQPGDVPATAPGAISRAGFTDNQIPGETTPQKGTINTINSNFMYIGGGRQVTGAGGVNIAGAAGTSPYTAGVAICGAGNAGVRDGGAGPAFTGFPIKMVTATGTVANGAAIEAGFNNRSGVSLTINQSANGVSTTQLAAPS